MSDIKEPNWVTFDTLLPYDVEMDVNAENGAPEQWRHRPRARTGEPVPEWQWGQPPAPETRTVPGDLIAVINGRSLDPAHDALVALVKASSGVMIQSRGVVELQDEHHRPMATILVTGDAWKTLAAAMGCAE